MKRYVNIILVFVTVAALVVATVEYKRLRADAKINNDAAAAVLKRNAAMKARMDSLKPTISRLADTGSDITSADISAMLASKEKAEKEAQAQGRAKYAADMKMQAERLKNDPDLALKHYASLRADAEMKYASFCRVQHLSQEQSEALAEAQFQRMLRLDDMQTARQLNEPGVDAKAITKEADDEFAASAKAALGDDLYEQFAVYQRQSAAWSYVNDYGGSVSLVDMPLSVQQASQLADAIANACPAFQKGKDVVLGDVDWDAVNTAAADFLTPEQMNFFKNAAISGGVRQSNDWIKTVYELAQ